VFIGGRLRHLVLIHPINNGIHQIRTELHEFEESLDPQDL
jgi:hypothetical protein